MSDKRLRDLARKLRASGDPDLAVRLAAELTTAGAMPSGEREYYGSTSRASFRVLPSYVERPFPDGPDLCLVPVVRSLLHVQIGPLRNMDDPPDPERDPPRAYYEARYTHQVDDDHPAIPGLPLEREGYGYGRNVKIQTYVIHYRPCPDLRYLLWQSSPRSRVWGLGGTATFSVDHETRSVTLLGGHYSRNGMPSLSVRARRSPPRYRTIESVSEADLVGPLTEFVSQWVAANTDAFEFADVEVDATQVARALSSVRAQEGVVEGALSRLSDSKIALRDTLITLLPRLGY